MADIELEQKHHLGRQAAKARIAEMETKLKERFGVSLTWSGDRASIDGKGVSGTIEVTDTELSVNIKLGFLMRPLKGKIQEAMQHQIDKALV